jgi:hypothetical protein
MRAFLLFLAVAAAGCAGTRDSQRPGRSSGIPVVREHPRLSERLGITRPRRDQSDKQAMIEVTGDIIR